MAKKKSKNTTLIIFLVIMIILVIAALLLYFFLFKENWHRRPPQYSRAGGIPRTFDKKNKWRMKKRKKSNKKMHPRTQRIQSSYRKLEPLRGRLTAPEQRGRFAAPEQRERLATAQIYNLQI